MNNTKKRPNSAATESRAVGLKKIHSKLFNLYYTIKSWFNQAECFKCGCSVSRPVKIGTYDICEPCFKELDKLWRSE